MEVAENIVLLPCLEELFTRNCDQLRSAPSHFPSLKKLEIDSMGSSMPIANISSNLATLTSLSLKKIKGLDCLQDGMLKNNKNLVYLKIEECPDLSSITSLSLKSVHISDCPKLRCLPDGLQTLVSLEELDIRRCLELIPDMHGLTCLSRLYIEDCPQLSRLPNGLEYCTSLKSVHISNCPKLRSLPDVLQTLVSLTQLYIRRCSSLVLIPDMHGLTSLCELSIYDCPQLSSSPTGLECCTSLQMLKIISCSRITSIPFEQGLPSVRELEITDCRELSSPPSGLEYCTSLQDLTISFCRKLTSTGIHSLPPTLHSLAICYCRSLESIPTLRGCPSLRKLKIGGSDGVISQLVTELEYCTSLHSLSIIGCQNLKHFPDGLQLSSSLEILIIRDCPNLETIPSLENLAHLHLHLHELQMVTCGGLKSLPGGLNSLTSLKKLDIGGFWKELDSVPPFQVLPQLESLSLTGI
ncbi:disease resistance protein TAO1-like [Malus domestica]|uniref:disease resistance protein TAO1-like n=1 Tax=Malus domestica TaxID=3750 RepID=UPI003975AD98